MKKYFNGMVVRPCSEQYIEVMHSSRTSFFVCRWRLAKNQYVDIHHLSNDHCYNIVVGALLGNRRVQENFLPLSGNALRLILEKASYGKSSLGAVPPPLKPVPRPNPALAFYVAKRHSSDLKAGERFKFAVGRLQRHKVVAVEPDVLVYRDPDGRLQEVFHCMMYCIELLEGEGE